MTCRNCGSDTALGTRFCGNCGSPVSTAESAQWRHVTVMFCDLVGSTPLAERLDPEDLRDVIVAYQNVCARVIERFEGFTAKYLGDGLLVYFGYPHAYEDDPQQAVHAGLGIIEGVAALNREQLRGSFGVSLQVRIGVHSGLVVAGEMGGGRTREEFAIVGSVPNVAARLEAAAEPDTVVISAATERLISGYFETESLGMLNLKGVSAPTEALRVTRATGAVNRFEAVTAGRMAPLVGRDLELRQLIERWSGVAGGRGALAYISGQAGIGKSRLARALRDRVRGQGTTQVWQCSPHHQSSALYPVIRYIEAAIGLDRSAPPETQLRTSREALERVSSQPNELLPLLANLLSIEMTGPSPLAERSSLDIRASTLQALETVLIGRPNEYPTLLIVEDLHWADPTTLELLSRIVVDISSLPIFAVFTFRPAFDPPWEGPAEIVRLPLDAMSPEEVSQLISFTTPGIVISADVRARVIDSADGVPLFAEEMARMLVLEHSERAGETTDRPEVDSVAVPPTLQGLLNARLDQLLDARGVAQVASVLGREFPLDVLKAISPVSATDLQLALDRMVQDNILRPVRGRGERYEFTHALLHDAAYASLLRRSRQAHHASAADAITHRFPSLAEREPEVVANHYALGGRPETAVTYWRAAGLRALARASFAEAAGHFHGAVEAIEKSETLPGRDTQLSDLLSHLATARQAGFGYASDGVNEPYERARAFCVASGNTAALVPVIRGLWLFHHVHADYATALVLGQQMLDLGLGSGDSEQLVEGHLYIGMVHMYLARFDKAREHFDEAIQLYRRPSHPSLIYGALGDSGVMAHAYLVPVLWNMGEPRAAQLHSDTSLTLADEIGEPMTFAQAWGMRILFHLGRKEWKQMATWAEKTREFAADRNIAYWLHLSSLLQHWLESRGERLGAGIAKVQESFDAYLATGARLGIPDFSNLLAGLHLAAKAPATGLEVLRAAEVHIEQTGEALTQPDVLRMKGHLLFALDPTDFGPPQAAYERALAVALGQKAMLPALRAAVDLARLSRRQGAIAHARTMLYELCAHFEPTIEMAEVIEARALLAELVASEGPAYSEDRRAGLQR